MIRRIIKIDEEKCTGCGICADACHEGAIDIVAGKAKLMREHYCDGLGDCLPACPVDAISFEEREAPAYDEAAVKAAQLAKQVAETAQTVEQSADSSLNVTNASETPAFQGCPGSRMRSIQHKNTSSAPQNASSCEGQLTNWPVQIKLAPVQAPYFENANLLVAADCTAFTYGNFHQEFIRNRVCLIGCPKLDAVDYTEKLTEIISRNDIKSVTIVRMEVPCCGGLEMACKNALQNSGKFIPWQVVTVGIDGQLLDR